MKMPLRPYHYVVRDSLLPVVIVRWQMNDREHRASVICKGTFDLTPGRLRLARRQDDVFPSPRSGMPTDVVPIKPRADVYVRGSAFAPPGTRTELLIASVAIGSLKKSIAVHADCAYSRDGRLERGKPFARASIGYEQAAGGKGTWNPVGIANDAVDGKGRLRIPTVRPVGFTLGSPGVAVPPIGFGPIPEHWDLRRSKLPSGTGLTASTWPAYMLGGVNSSFFNAAPADQQLVSVGDEETLTLEHLHSELPTFVTSLPGMRLRAIFGGMSATMRIDTVAIDTERSTCALTWRTVIPCEADADFQDVVIDFEKGPSAPPPPASSTTSVTMPPPMSKGTVALEAERAPTLDGPTCTTELPEEITAVTKVLTHHASAAALPFKPPAPPADDEEFGNRTIILRPADPPAPPILPPPSSPPPSSSEAPSSPASSVAPLSLLTGQTLGQQLVLQKGPGASGPSAERSTTPAPFIAPLDAPIMSDPSTAMDEPMFGRSDPILRDAGPQLDVSPGESLQLLWFEQNAMKRMRAEYRDIVEQMSPISFDSPLAAMFETPKDLQMRMEIGAIIKQAPVAQGNELAGLLRRSVESDFFVPPLVVTDGLLSLSYDELRALEIAVQVAAPLATADEALRGAVERARVGLANPDAFSERGLQDLAQALMERFRAAAHGLPAGFLKKQTERLLLDRRAYKRRSFMNAEWLRAEIVFSSGTPPLPTYLPAALADELPLLSAFRARVIAELLPAQDHRERSPMAARLYALSRRIRFDGADGAHAS
ncbi:MAG: DUF2169 domain-containing protein [Polyangiaceae bacterium]|nr:DUF2169 domain-containing protein [Polyangiaceae bacterium]